MLASFKRIDEVVHVHLHISRRIARRAGELLVPKSGPKSALNPESALSKFYFLLSAARFFLAFKKRRKSSLGPSQVFFGTSFDTTIT